MMKGYKKNLIFTANKGLLFLLTKINIIFDTLMLFLVFVLI